MKSNFIIELPNKEIDNTGTYKNWLLNDTVFKKYPYLKSDATHSPTPLYRDISYAGPLDGILFDSKTAYDMTYLPKSLLSSGYYSKTPKYNLYYDYDKIEKLLADYARSKYVEDPYDFTINGIPVTICGTYIRIGNSIIPKGAGFGYFNSLTPEIKKEINIVINITINMIDDTYIIAA